jgi:hypothetical protein
MMRFIKNKIADFLTSDSGYRLIGSKLSRTMNYYGGYVDYHRLLRQQQAKILVNPELKIDENALSKILEQMTVLHGPFKGMKYPKIDGQSGKYISGPILSKMLGCYERELHTVIKDCIGKVYSHVLTIGCAEGYYTVGLAVKMPHAEHIAFDTDGIARTLLQRIATMNGVSDRIKIRAFCDGAELNALLSKSRALIICDCEGFEKDLFAGAAVDNLSNCDILVELHDFADVSIYPTIHGLFQQTHQETIIDSFSVAKKIRDYKYPELEGLNYVTVNKIVSEYRPQQEWLFLEPKATA